MTECGGCASMLFPIHPQCQLARERRQAKRWRYIDGQIAEGEYMGELEDRIERQEFAEMRVEEIVSGLLV